MERRDLPFDQILEQEIQEWKEFRRALRVEDQQFLDRLFEKAMLHVEAGMLASRPWPFETILISILLEHEKALAELKSQMKAHENQEGGEGIARNQMREDDQWSANPKTSVSNQY
ncbi:MAG TPA: hypothetical protein VMV04_05995 [Thermodesulfobacteriota bacterium]|nr:hypothetical protein [Thermodesulfobacteriota bacterium]